MLSKDKKFPVIECFGPTIQGEGILAGSVTDFIRFGGCPYKCTWCDSLHAVLPELIKKNATYMTAADIICKVASLESRSPWMTISGGDPVMWSLQELVDNLKTSGYKVNVETEGALYRAWVQSCDQVTVSPKPPSSGMADKINHDVLSSYCSTVGDPLIFKIVVFDGQDYLWAKKIHERYPHVSLYLSVGTKQGFNDKDTKFLIMEGLRDLFDRVRNDECMHDVIVLPQLHVLAWGTKLGV